MTKRLAHSHLHVGSSKLYFRAVAQYSTGHFLGLLRVLSQGLENALGPLGGLVLRSLQTSASVM